MRYGKNESAIKKRDTFFHGNCSRIECCRKLKSETLEKTINAVGNRYRLNHKTKKYELEENPKPFTGVIVGIRSDEEGLLPFSSENVFSTT